MDDALTIPPNGEKWNQAGIWVLPSCAGSVQAVPANTPPTPTWPEFSCQSWRFTPQLINQSKNVKSNAQVLVNIVEGGGIYDLYSSPPLEGDWVPLASLLGCSLGSTKCMIFLEPKDESQAGLFDLAGSDSVFMTINTWKCVRAWIVSSSSSIKPVLTGDRSEVMSSYAPRTSFVLH